MAKASDVATIRERYAHARDAWQDIRKEAETDMRFVSGDPWDDDDRRARKNRPTIAPDELSQYRNQVVNALMASPRGVKFSPTGNGANDQGAAFYQNKWREIEYRSKAPRAYITAADNALQRSYGFVRVRTQYASPRSPNQEIWIEAVENPDMVLPDPDAMDVTSRDMRYCFVLQWQDEKAFHGTEYGKRAKAAKARRSFGARAKDALQGLMGNVGDWIAGDKVLTAEHWEIVTRPRPLLGAPVMRPGPQGPVPSMLFFFEDEREGLLRARVQLGEIKPIRTVDYPEVVMSLTDGQDILHEQQWPGKYIPIVSCYGKVLYVPEGGRVKRKILSLTRFGRDPWKAFCYACSQELEILGQIPKASVVAYEGQLSGHEPEWQESLSTPKAYLYARAYVEGMPQGSNPLPLPSRLGYVQGEYLQAVEMVKEGFRRSIQAAMGSNFLPTEAQRVNDKSGIALEKMNQAATQGTYHFVYSYEAMIGQVGTIGEDLMDKIHDYAGETGVLLPDMKSMIVPINQSHDPEAITTKGDYLVTVSTAPSSDSERDAAAELTDTLIGRIEMIVQTSGPKVAAAVLARSIRGRNLGVLGDALADLIEPAEFKTKDGEPPNPELLQAQAQIQHLTEQLQAALQEKQAKAAELQGKFTIEQMKEAAETDRAAADREVKLAIAAIAAKTDRIALMMEESRLVGIRASEVADAERGRVAEHRRTQHERAHDDIQRAKDRSHEHIQGELDRQHAADLQAEQQAAQAEQQAITQPPDGSVQE